jgi:hypothetical protein
MLSAFQWGCIGVGAGCMFGLSALFFHVIHGHFPWEYDDDA